MKKVLLTVFSLVIILGMCFSPTSADTPTGDPRVTGLGEPTPAELEVIDDGSTVDTYIVLLKGESLASYSGGVAGLRATSPAETGAFKLDVTSAESVAYLDYLHGEQDAFLSSLQSKLGRAPEFKFRYDVVLNGFALELSAADARSISKMDSVKLVVKDEIRQLETDVSPEFLGATTIWDAAENTTPGDLETMGEGMLIGVLDTGINMDHPSFAEIGPVDGYVHVNPFGTGIYKGFCATDPTNYICNDKLVGVYGYTAETLIGEDHHAHGSHTSSTAAGNFLTTDYNGIEVTISGMAPHANIIMYDVCDDDGCANSGSVAAVNQAVADGVDVINYSIGPNSASDSYADPVELAMLDAITAGVLTSTSAGNSGPDASTTYKAPAWSIVVANSSHNRSFGVNVIVDVDPTEGDSFEMTGVIGTGPAFTGSITGSLKWAGPSYIEGCNTTPFPADYFKGYIALISRGTCGFAEKVTNATTAGADAVIVYNNRSGPAIVMGALEPTTIPSVMVDQTDGLAAVAYLTTHADDDVVVEITDTFVRRVNDDWADIIDSQTSRGPYLLHDILEPEVAAPGTNIMAAYNTPGATAPFGQVDPGDDVEIDLMSGTSMASPHVAGSALLLKDLFPTWTPLEIKSALMMTADTSTMLKDDGATPADVFDVGNGRIDLRKAALTGLVMNETKANFVAADPAEDGDVKTLNIPSYQNSQCIGDCSFTRTFKSVADVDVDYTAVVDMPAGVVLTVTPSTFTIPAGGTQAVLFEINVDGAAMGTWQLGYVSFETTDFFTTGEAISDVRLTLAVMPDPGNLPALVEKEVYRDAGGVVLEDLYSIEITEMTFEQAGLTEASYYDFALDVDPTNGDPYDVLDDIWYTSFTVPAYTKRLVFEVLETTSSDLDMFMGEGTIPSLASEITMSATATAYEYISFVDPTEEDPITVWVLIQNYAGAPGDTVKLAVGILPKVDEGNLDITGPDSVAAGDFFDLTLTWDIPEMEPVSAWYGWFSMGSEAGSPGDIGETEVNIYRPYDDVTKEASVAEAEYGDVVTYTITIEPNETGADLAYDIEDILPAGVSYVDGSLETVGSFTEATYDEVANSINWSGTMPKIEYTYIASTPENNPDYCDTPFGGYLDLKSAYGVNPSTGIFGDGKAWAYTSLGTGTQFYGETIPTKPTFTDDGHFYMYPTTFYPDDYWMWVNQEFPDPTVPNGIVAPWMRDMIIVAQAGTKGVSAVSFSGGALWMIEFDDVVDYYSSEPAYAPYATGVMDYEVIVWRDLDPSIGWPDIVFAFDNVTGDWDWAGGPWGSVGLEDITGTVGTNFAYDNWTPTSGDIVCLDYAVAGAEPVVITFDVLVEGDSGDLVTNTALHTADGIGMREEATTAEFSVNLTFIDIDLFHSLDVTTWLPVPGSYEEGFALLMDPLEEYYYLDADNLVVNGTLSDGLHPFFLDTTAVLPAGFEAYWTAKGVVSGATGWQGVMFDIISGTQPMFYLRVDGTSYDLIDGLQYLAGSGENPLRVSGDYPVGTYLFNGTVSDAFGDADVIVDITFLAPFDLTDLDLLSSIDLVGWEDVAGTFADGFFLGLDPVNDYYYLDTEDLVANRPVGDGFYPFYLDQTALPAGFEAYWIAKGVVSGATGWQGVMYQIITGAQPMFYLKVDGTSYDLIDGLQFLTTAEENPLRVSGDYPFGTYTFSGEVEDEFGYSDDVMVDITFLSILELTDLDLLSSVDKVTWTPVPGTFEDGFGLVIYPLVEYYYLDAEALVVNRPLADGMHPFFLDTTALPAGFYSYWSAKGVVFGATGWQGVMWQIINGDQPMFYLKVDGTAYDLVDGLQYLAGSGEQPLRVTGDYPLGTYSFVGDVTDDFGLKDNVAVDITFMEALALTDLDLLSSLDMVAWEPVVGTFADGFALTLDPVNDYYYLDTENLVVNRPIADGSYPFFLDQTALPTGFAAYWDAKGVTASADPASWQGVMYQIITGAQPMFYLKVDGTSYDLIDGLQFLIGQGENPLRVSGDYPFGTYTFTGDVADEWGYTDDVTVDITFNDKPVALDDSYQTDEDVAIAIVLEATDGWPGSGFTWIVGDPANGTLTGTAPNLTYTPDADFYGTDSFTFHVNDGFNDSNVATITIEVLPLNDSPLAVDDHYTTPMSTTLTVAAPGVMANDIDPDPTDLKMVILVSGPSHGSVTLYGDGSFVYVLDAGYMGPDSFIYNFLSLPTRAFIDQAVVYIDVTGYMYFLPLIFK